MIYWLTALAILALWFSLRYAWWRPTIDYKRPRILMYHMVRGHVPGTRFNGLRVPPATFDQQLAWLKSNGWGFMTLSELMSAGRSVPAKTAVLTFDDGYRDNLINALPIMKKYGAKATLFLVDQRHGNDWSTKKKAHHDSGELVAEEKLSDDEVRELLSSGLFELGAHTFTHANLPALDESPRHREVVEIKQHLEKLFGVPVQTFAYPFGIYDHADVALAKQAKYQAAVTTLAGIDECFTDNAFQLKRVKISGKEGMYAFKLRMRIGKRGWKK